MNSFAHVLLTQNELYILQFTWTSPLGSAAPFTFKCPHWGLPLPHCSSLGPAEKFATKRPQRLGSSGSRTAAKPTAPVTAGRLPIQKALPALWLFLSCYEHVVSSF